MFNKKNPKQEVAEILAEKDKAKGIAPPQKGRNRFRRSSLTRVPTDHSMPTGAPKIPTFE